MPASRGMRVALVLVFAWFFLGGIAHFAFTTAEMRAVPAWVTWPREAVLVSGALELVGAFGLLWPRSRRAAAWGLFALTVAVTPANIYMYQQHQLFSSVPVWALAARLPLQLALLALIAWLAWRSPGGRSRKSLDTLRSLTQSSNS